MAEQLTRAQVKEPLTWNLADLFPSQEAWEAELAALNTAMPGVAQYAGRLGKGAGVLADCLDAMEALYIKVTRVYTYASLLISGDGSDPVHQASMGRVGAAVAQIESELSFVESEIVALPDGVVEDYVGAEKRLADLRKYLQDILDTKPHKLLPETEAVLSALGEVLQAPGMIYERSKTSDMTFAPVADSAGSEHPVSFALYEDHFEQSADNELRRRAYGSFAETLAHYQHTFAATYATEVKRQVITARLRGYESATRMLLHPQQVTMDMYHNVLDIIQTELAPHMRRLARLRQRILGLDRMLVCDLKAPLDAAYVPQTTYEQAERMIRESLSVLGDEYGDILKRAFSERWVDLADNIGKSSGAFCSDTYGVHPYILLTWTDNMRSAFTLAHELGHAGHGELAGRNQRMLNTWPSMYFIEAPSTLNELLLAQHILAHTDDARMRRWVILQSLGTYYHNFVTHLLEGELQRRVYALAEEGQPITATVLCEQKGDVLSQFWGDAVEIDDGARLTWMRQPHYYAGLYPYTYAAGLSAATAVAQMIREEGQPAVDRWLKALKTGGTLPPLELMRVAGVDMEKPEPIRKAVAYVGSLVDELEASF
ncbi:MAG: oligoendopeptidase F [Bacilli bacterium]